MDIDADIRKSLLSGINGITNILDNISGDKDDRSIVDKIMHKVFSSYGDIYDEKKAEELIEDLQENDLHVSYNKLKTL
jgi:hypothetical protein